MQTLKKRPLGRSSLAKRSGFWGRNLRKFHPKPSQSDLGRFISADPIGFAGGLNLYSYSSNNPVGRVDPSGLRDRKEDYRAAAAAMGEASTRYYHSGPDSLPFVITEALKWDIGFPIRTQYGPETDAVKALQTDTRRIKVVMEEFKRRGCPKAGSKIFPDDFPSKISLLGKIIGRKNWGLNGGPLQAGFSPTLQQVGGYGVQLTPQSNGSIKYEVINEISNKSLKFDGLFYPVENNPNGADGPRHTQTQHFYWYVDSSGNPVSGP